MMRLLCDSSISRIITGPETLPIDLGRAIRTPSAGLRRAIVARDDGCRFPGCDRPSGWCDAHQIIHWVDGGRTDRDNLVLLCDHHHRVVHRRGRAIKFDGRELRVLRPDGTELT
jgi:HNH endonuclease